MFAVGHKQMADEELLVIPAAGPVTPLRLFVCTYVARLANLHVGVRLLTDLIVNQIRDHPDPRCPVVAFNSNYGHAAQPGWEHLIKHRRPTPERPMPQRGRPRKYQGDGTCFNSAIEPIISIQHPGVPADKVYFVKCFPTTGETQVPGVICSDLSDAGVVLASFVAYLNALGVGDPIVGGPGAELAEPRRSAASTEKLGAVSAKEGSAPAGAKKLEAGGAEGSAAAGAEELLSPPELEASGAEESAAVGTTESAAAESVESAAAVGSKELAVAGAEGGAVAGAEESAVAGAEESAAAETAEIAVAAGKGAAAGAENEVADPMDALRGLLLLNLVAQSFPDDQLREPGPRSVGLDPATVAGLDSALAELLGEGEFRADSAPVVEPAAPPVPRRAVEIQTEGPNMINMKFNISRTSPRILLNLRSLAQYLGALEAAGLTRGALVTAEQAAVFARWPALVLPPYLIRETKPPSDDVKASFCFTSPEWVAAQSHSGQARGKARAAPGRPARPPPSTQRNPRVNIFQSGKVNILGAVTIESARQVHQFFSQLFAANWRALISLQPLRDQERARRASVAGQAGPAAPVPARLQAASAGPALAAPRKGKDGLTPLALPPPKLPLSAAPSFSPFASKFLTGLDALEGGGDSDSDSDSGSGSAEPALAPALAPSK